MTQKTYTTSEGSKDLRRQVRDECGLWIQEQCGVYAPTLPFTSNKRQFPYVSKGGLNPMGLSVHRKGSHTENASSPHHTRAAALLLLWLPPPKSPHSVAREPGLEARPPLPDSAYPLPYAASSTQYPAPLFSPSSISAGLRAA